MFKRTLWLAQLRFHRRHPWQLLLTVVGLTLGVTVVVAIDIAIDSSLQSFHQSARALSGTATHTISVSGQGVPERLFTRIRVDLGLHDSAPIVSGRVNVVDKDRQVQVLGIDPFSEIGLRQYLLAGRRFQIGFGAGAAMPGVYMSSSLARSLGIEVGDSFSITYGARVHEVVLRGHLQTDDELLTLGLRKVIVMDIADAQTVLAMPGRLSRIDLRLTDPQQLSALTASLPPAAQLQAVDASQKVMEQMTRAFHINLTALSYLALLVGLFIIYNAMMFSVVQRYQLFGILRAAGVGRDQVFYTVMTEALVLAALATVAGLAAGSVLARGLLFLVARTTSDLYLDLPDYAIFVQPLTLVKAAVLGLAGSLLACWLPARVAMQVPPRQLFGRMYWQQRSHRRSLRWGWVGAVLMPASLALLYFSDNLTMGFAALFFLVAGFALIVPGLIVLLCNISTPVLGAMLGCIGRMAVRNNVRALNRTGVATASLAIALSAVIGVSIMIGSFRHSLIDWLQYRLQADIYISLEQRGPGLTIAPEVISQLRRQTQITAIHAGLRVPVLTEVGEVEAMVVETSPVLRQSFQILAQSTAAMWEEVAAGRALLVSEPLANHHGLVPGQTFRLQTVTGEQVFTVAGIFRDYGSDRGRVLLHRDSYRRFWQDERISSLALMVRDDVDVAKYADQLRDQLAQQGLNIFSSREIRGLSLQVFDRTFTVTEVLRALVLLVAFIGIISSLMAVQLERIRDMAVLRAMGLTPQQLRFMLLLETFMQGAMAGLFAIPLGLLLAWGLIFVINLRAFGWGMDMVLAPGVLLATWLLAVFAALLAGLYPARKALAQAPAAVLQGE